MENRPSIPDRPSKDFLPEEEFRKQRRQYVGGSDISTILGLNSYMSALELFLLKTGQIPPFEGNISTEVGSNLEPYCAKKFEQWFLEKRGVVIETKTPEHLYVDPDIDYFVGNLDRSFENPLISNMECGLEIKTSGERALEDWQGDNIPDGAYLQIQWYYMLSNFPEFYVAALIGNRDFIVKFVPRNDSIIGIMRVRAQEFMEEFIRKNIPPSPDGSKSAKEALAKMYADAEDSTIDLTCYEELYFIYKTLEKKNKGITVEMEEIAQKFKMEMKTASVAIINDKRITWKIVKKDGYFVKPTSYRMFRIW